MEATGARYNYSSISSCQQRARKRNLRTCLLRLLLFLLRAQYYDSIISLEDLWPTVWTTVARSGESWSCSASAAGTCTGPGGHLLRANLWRAPQGCRPRRLNDGWLGGSARLSGETARWGQFGASNFAASGGRSKLKIFQLSRSVRSQSQRTPRSKAKNSFPRLDNWRPLANRTTKTIDAELLASRSNYHLAVV